MALPSAHTLLSRAVGTVTQTPGEQDADDPDTTGRQGAEGRRRRGASSQPGWLRVYGEDAETLGL